MNDKAILRALHAARDPTVQTDEESRSIATHRKSSGDALHKHDAGTATPAQYTNFSRIMCTGYVNRAACDVACDTATTPVANALVELWAPKARRRARVRAFHGQRRRTSVRSFSCQQLQKKPGVQHQDSPPGWLHYLDSFTCVLPVWVLQLLFFARTSFTTS